MNMKNLKVEALTSQRLKGFAYTPRGVYKLMLEGVITKPQALYYKFLLEAAVDWDRRHASYGLIPYSQNELAQAYKVNSSTISKLHTALLKIGLLHQSEYGYLGISHYKTMDSIKKKKGMEIINPLNLPYIDEILPRSIEEIHSEHEIKQYLSESEVRELVAAIGNSEEANTDKSNFF